MHEPDFLPIGRGMWYNAGMRIIIDIDEVRDREKGRSVRVRTHWYGNSKDCVRVQNCGMEIYNAIKEGFDQRTTGGVVVHEGERR